MNIYFNCFLIGLIGLALSVLTVFRSVYLKAKQNNIIFPWKTFFGIDFFIQFIGSMLTVAAALMLLGPFLKQYPKFIDNTLAVLAGFATIGYVGSDIASRFFSVANSRINGAIGYKTSQTDEANGTTGAPTPAAKPQP